MSALLLVFASLLIGQAQPSIVDDVTKMSAATTNEQRFEMLTSMLKARKLAFTVEPFTIPKPLGKEPRTEGRNVVVTVGQGDGLVIVGAHYDAVRLQDGSLSKGAVDNAASSMLLIRAAEAMRAETLRVRIRFVWFDMEELGLIGSTQYLQQHAGERVTAMLNFDVNGYGNTIVFGPSDHQGNAELRKTVMQTCGAEAATCVAFPVMPPSDDRPFVKTGAPTLSFGILPSLEAHQLWLMMNGGPNSGLEKGAVPPILQTIHTTADTPDKIKEEDSARMLRFMTALLRGVAAR